MPRCILRFSFCKLSLASFVCFTESASYSFASRKYVIPTWLWLPCYVAKRPALLKASVVVALLVSLEEAMKLLWNQLGHRYQWTVPIEHILNPSSVLFCTLSRGRTARTSPPGWRKLWLAQQFMTRSSPTVQREENYEDLRTPQCWEISW